MEQIIQLISNVGIPIACCIFLFNQQAKLTKGGAKDGKKKETV